MSPISLRVPVCLRLKWLSRQMTARISFVSTSYSRPVFGDNVVKGVDIKVKSNTGGAGHQQPDHQRYDGKMQDLSCHARFHKPILNQLNRIGQLQKVFRMG